MKRLIVTLAALACAVAFTGAAGAAKPCSEQILDEWLKQSIKTTHPISCYDQAIKSAPEEVVLYQDFVEQVLTAKRIAVRARNQTTSKPRTAAPQPAPAPAAPPAAPPQEQPPAEQPPAEEPVIEPIAPAPPVAPVEVPVVDGVPSTQDPSLEGVAPVIAPGEPVAETPPPISEPEPTTPAPGAPSEGPLTEAIASLGPDEARSVPTPLIALSLITGLLALAGVSVLGLRYAQTRRVTPLPPPRPPVGDGDGTG